MHNTNLRRTLGVALIAVFALAGTVCAQLQTGSIYGTATDQKGAALPGVTVTLSGGGAPSVQVTNAQGQFRFLDLSPGSYKLTANLDGFSPLDYPNVNVSVGRNTSIEMTLQSAVTETITVTTESPLLDERKISTGTTVNQVNLEKIPTSRDPWSILQQTPGVLTDRINVGGNESGQQSLYVGPGSGGDQATWAVDGVVITDMGALGSSPTYYDFDAFSEMQVTTGGTDTSLATGGVTLNMVTKRGTNEWRGSARFLETKDSWQSSTALSRSDLGKAGPWQGGASSRIPQSVLLSGNEIGEVQDYGGEVGGPIIKDKLWIWGAYGNQDVKNRVIAPANAFTFTQTVLLNDNTQLETWNGKLNAQFAANNSATAFYLLGNKTKQGRGAGPTKTQAASWDQTGPTRVYKVEDTHIFSSNFYLTGLASYVDGGFSLTPEGGLNINPSLDGNFVWNNSYLLYETERPQHQYKVDGSNFFNTGNLTHELKFGVSYRTANVTSHTRWAGFGYQEDYYIGYGYPYNVIALTRDSHATVDMTYKDVYLQDTLTTGNLTANIGLRYDDQGGENQASSVPANAAFPGLLGAATVGARDIGFSWTNLTPRLGLTYALGKERKTLLRASYSRFADQLGAYYGLLQNAAYGVSYAYVTYDDVNHNGQADPSELLELCPAGYCSSKFAGHINPLNANALVPNNGVSSHFHAPITDEVLLGIEHSLLPEFVVGLNLTYRKITDLAELEQLVFDGDVADDAFSPANIGSLGRRATRNDYVFHPLTGTLPDGSPYPAGSGYYELRSGLASRGGIFMFNGDREQTYKGASLNFNKRLSNRWMLRGNITYADWKWDVPSNALANQTESLNTQGYPGGAHDGDPVLQGSGTGSGAKGGVYINSKWSYNVNGLYQVAPDRGWGFNLGFNLTGREGYAIPYYRRVTRTSGPGFQRVIIGGLDDFRNDNVNVLDLRIEKEFPFSQVNLTIGADCFNALNEGTVLQRQHRLNRPNTNYVQEVLSPRIFRIGARLSFR